MHKKRSAALFTLSASAVLLTGCVSSITLGEYPVATSIPDLASNATDIVEVHIVNHHDGEILPEPFTGDDPIANPYAGTTESPPQLEDSAYDVIVYEATVVEAFVGDRETGEAIQIHQTSNDGNLTYLEDDKTYVLFLRDVGDQPAGIVGGDQGRMVWTATRSIQSTRQSAWLSTERLSKP